MSGTERGVPVDRISRGLLGQGVRHSRPCSAHLGRQDEATRGFPYVLLVMGVPLPLAASGACLCLRLRRFCVSLVLGFRRLWVQLDLCDPFHK